MPLENPTTHSLTVTRPSRQTETRHHPQGKTCHHFMYHGLTCDEYDALRARASGHCELCGVSEGASGGRRLVVDHFQGPGVRFIRGLLCDRCNAAMSCLDGRKAWGDNRRWESAARDYEARSWQQPAPEQAALAEQARRDRRAHRAKLLAIAQRRDAAKRAAA